MRVIRATGAVADAIRRYDPNIDVRFSWQRKAWAITYRTRRPDLIPTPVKIVPKGFSASAGFVEERLPELSEESVSYKTKTYPVAYVPRLSWKALDALVSSDTLKGGSIKEQIRNARDQRDLEYHKKAKDRYRAARDFLRWHGRTHIMAD